MPILNILVNTLSGVKESCEWILETGFWADNKVWVDLENWND